MRESVAREINDAYRDLCQAMRQHSTVMLASMRQTWDMKALRDRYRGIGEDRIRKLIHEHGLQARVGRGIGICLNIEDVLRLDRIVKATRDDPR